jgi:hypothetical protein
MFLEQHVPWEETQLSRHLLWSATLQYMGLLEKQMVLLSAARFQTVKSSLDSTHVLGHRFRHLEFITPEKCSTVPLMCCLVKDHLIASVDTSNLFPEFQQ